MLYQQMWQIVRDSKISGVQWNRNTNGPVLVHFFLQLFQIRRMSFLLFNNKKLTKHLRKKNRWGLALMVLIAKTSRKVRFEAIDLIYSTLFAECIHEFLSLWNFIWRETPRFFNETLKNVQKRKLDKKRLRSETFWRKNQIVRPLSVRLSVQQNS